MTAATTIDATAHVDLLQRRRWLAEQTEWIAASSRAGDLGRRARRAYLDRNQIRNLQRVAETSAAVSDLTDYVKTQAGKHPLWRRENFGLMLLDDLERLRNRASVSGAAVGDPYLALCRLYVRQLAASYVYSIAVDAAAPRPAAPPARPAAPAREGGRPARQRGPRSTTVPAAGQTDKDVEPVGDVPPLAAVEQPAPPREAPEDAGPAQASTALVDSEHRGPDGPAPAAGAERPRPSEADQGADSTDAAPQATSPGTPEGQIETMHAERAASGEAVEPPDSRSVDDADSRADQVQRSSEGERT